MEASTTERMIKSLVSAQSQIMVFMMAEGWILLILER